MVHGGGGGGGGECASRRGMYQAFEAEVTLKVLVLAGTAKHYQHPFRKMMNS